MTLPIQCENPIPHLTPFLRLEKLVACGAEAMKYDLGLNPGAFVRIENFKMYLHGPDMLVRHGLCLKRMLVR